MTADPHLEEVVPFSPGARQAAIADTATALGGLVAALVLMPNRWLVMTALYVGGSCLFGLLPSAFAWRKLRRQLAAAPPVPPDAVEVQRHGSRLKGISSVPFRLALLLGAGWVGSVLEDASFAWGLLFAAVLLGASAAADLAEGWSVGRWERRNGRILSSLLLVPDRVFYVDRGAQTA